jgi:hypothetical protein
VIGIAASGWDGTGAAAASLAASRARALPGRLLWRNRGFLTLT